MIFVTDRQAVPQTYYNYDDLNRVELNSIDISIFLSQYGYGNVLTGKTDWLISDFPRDTAMQNYIDNVNYLKNIFYSLAPDPPTNMNNIDYIDANNIEKTQESVYNLINETVRISPKLAFTLGGSRFG